MIDRAAANILWLRDVRPLTDYKTSDQPCLSHTFSLTGKVSNLHILKQFRKAFNKSIQMRTIILDIETTL